MTWIREDVAQAPSRWWSYVVLTKPDVTFLVVITTVSGFYLASRGPLNWLLLFQTLCGTMLVAGGTAALNQYAERDIDSLMRRTAARPLPSRQLQPLEVLVFGAGAIFVGSIWLALDVNGLAALIALATCLLYLGAYTPLKKKTPWATALGAFPGALPPLIGWAAATGSITLGGWILFGILFFWQFPHFMSIAWIYRQDYARAGVKMLPVVDPQGDATFRQIIWTSIVLVPVTLLPSLLGIVGTSYFFGALFLGLALAQLGFWANRTRTNVRAKWLMHATVAYIPLLLGWMIFDRLVR
jgi:heme o synthase